MIGPAYIHLIVIFKTNADCEPIIGGTGNYEYETTQVRGAISLATSFINSDGIYEIRWQPDINGVMPDLVNDIRVLQNGDLEMLNFQLGLMFIVLLVSPT